MLKERADIEQSYAARLKSWRTKWTLPVYFSEGKIVKSRKARNIGFFLENVYLFFIFRRRLQNLFRVDCFKILEFFSS